MQDRHVVGAAIGSESAERTHFFIRTSFERNRFSVSEVDENFEALGGRNRQLRKRDWRPEKASVRGYDVKCPLIVETQLEILGVSSIEESQSYETPRNSDYWSDDPVHDDSFAPRAICNVEGIEGIVIVFNRSIRTERAFLHNYWQIVEAECAR
jgi:hypothetical protein